MLNLLILSVVTFAKNSFPHFDKSGGGGNPGPTVVLTAPIWLSKAQIEAVAGPCELYEKAGAKSYILIFGKVDSDLSLQILYKGGPFLDTMPQRLTATGSFEPDSWSKSVAPKIFGHEDSKGVDFVWFTGDQAKRMRDACREYSVRTHDRIGVDILKRSDVGLIVKFKAEIPGGFESVAFRLTDRGVLGKANFSLPATKRRWDETLKVEHYFVVAGSR